MLRSAPAPTLPESCVPNVYYLDDPTDGASTYLLTQMGLSLSRGGDITALRRAMPQVGLWLTAVHQEHSFPFPVRYSADEGGVAVDVAAGQALRCPWPVQQTLLPVREGFPV